MPSPMTSRNMRGTWILGRDGRTSQRTKGGGCSLEYTLVRFRASLFSLDVTLDIAFDVVDAPFLNFGSSIVGSSIGCNVSLQSACAAPPSFHEVFMQFLYCHVFESGMTLPLMYWLPCRLADVRGIK